MQFIIEDWRSLRERLLNEAIELFVADPCELHDDPQFAIEPLQVHLGVPLF
ncbi:hypothetical protein [Pseudomonas cavernicola]|uniref:hypothetical protein n=1 Tax=Pseudomonas cavernicola TaxID=2320866 RepID=UPI0013147468|nr:hypothetical protein [Pseudomonas cavernicola]